MPDPEVKLREITGQQTGKFALRFPENLGADDNYPESKKIIVFTFKERLKANQMKPRGYIALPLPELNEGVNVKYNEASLGVAGAIAIGSVSNGLPSDVEQFRNLIGNGIRSFNADSFARISTDIALSGAKNLKGFVAKGLGTIQNPFMTNIFENVGFREFKFDFMLQPKSSTESQNLNEIIKTFKKYMLAKDIMTEEETTGSSVIPPQNTGIQRMPDLLDISFFPTTQNFANSKNLDRYTFKIRDAVITSFNVSYSEGTSTPQFFKDNAPFNAKIDIAVKETNIYTKERCEEDYGSILETDAFISASAG